MGHPGQFGTLELLKRDSTLQVELIGGTLPKRSSEEAAGLDLYASKDQTIKPGTRALVDTGIQIKLPSGTYGRIAPRSGMSVKGIDVSAGVIDRDYRGEVKVLLHNHGSTALEVKPGDRIAQLIVERIAMVDIEEVENLDATERGDKGFGSTGT